jgi:hypothetical protein
MALSQNMKYNHKIFHAPMIRQLNTDAMNTTECKRVSSGTGADARRITGKEYRSERACVKEQH